MSKDPISNTPSPECYILTNSKKSVNYEKIFQSVKNIITCQNKIALSLEYATMDFEKGLHVGFLNVFENVSLIGCLFHFRQALHRYAAKVGLKRKKHKDETLKVIQGLGNFVRITIL